MKTGLAAGLFAMVVGLAPVALAVAPNPASSLAVIAPPWQRGAALQIASAAGGTLVAASAGGAVAIVRSDDPAIIDHLYSAGALLVLDATAVQACLRIVASSSHALEIADRKSHAQ
jgi:hypothetical protein